MFDIIMGARLSMNIIVDLGAGLGGATEAFIDCENWRVLRFDIAKEVEHVEEMRLVDYVNDTSEIIRQVRAEMHMLDLNSSNLYIWASPECKEWSDGFHSKKCKMRRRGETFVPDLTQLTAIKHIVEVLKPKAWIVENVKGGLEFINPVLGPPATLRNPIFLWGEFPLFRIPKNLGKKTDLGPTKMRYWTRSKLPIEFSRSMKRAFENQTSLMEFLVE
jgi:hypothetical protein